MASPEVVAASARNLAAPTGHDPPLTAAANTPRYCQGGLGVPYNCHCSTLQKVASEAEVAAKKQAGDTKKKVGCRREVVSFDLKIDVINRCY